MLRPVGTVLRGSGRALVWVLDERGGDAHGMRGDALGRALVVVLDDRRGAPGGGAPRLRDR